MISLIAARERIGADHRQSRGIARCRRMIFGACTFALPDVLFRCDAPEFTDTGIDGLNAGGVTTAISGLSVFSAVSVGAGSAFAFRSPCVGFAALASNCKGAFGASRGFPNMMFGNFRSLRDFEIRRRRRLNNRLMIIVRVRGLETIVRRFCDAELPSGRNRSAHGSVQRTAARAWPARCAAAFSEVGGGYAVINNLGLRDRIVKCGNAVWISLMQIDNQQNRHGMK